MKEIKLRIRDSAPGGKEINVIRDLKELIPQVKEVALHNFVNVESHGDSQYWHGFHRALVDVMEFIEGRKESLETYIK